jgi:hypothetical protein
MTGGGIRRREAAECTGGMKMGEERLKLLFCHSTRYRPEGLSAFGFF